MSMNCASLELGVYNSWISEVLVVNIDTRHVAKIAHAWPLTPKYLIHILIFGGARLIDNQS